MLFALHLRPRSRPLRLLLSRTPLSSRNPVFAAHLRPFFHPKSRNAHQSASAGRGYIRTLAYCIALALPVFIASADPGFPSQTQHSFNLWPTSSHPPKAIPQESSSSNRFFVAMTVLPGRPETLTAEEEAKLKEFWTVTLRVFGAEADGAEQGSSLDGEDDQTSTESPPSESGEKTKKKKSLGRLLSRKDKRSGKETKAKEPALSSVVESIPDDAANDKYGQTKDFKAAMATQTPEELRQAFWSMVKCDNPDALLLRFLRARKWDVQKALVMMVSTMNWRAKEMDVQGIIEKGEAGAIAENDEGFIKQLRMGKSFLHGLDAEGRPICFVRVRLHQKKDQSDESLERYTIYIMETARLMLHPPVDTACVVFDMTDFSLNNMDYNPVKFMIKCFEAHYPESLGVCLVHNAPWVFQGIWSIIRGWLDPVVAGKIHFTRSVEEIEKFIPKSRIIKELGGDEDWEYRYIEPVEGENAVMKDTAALDKLSKERDEQVLGYQKLTWAWIGTTGEPSQKIKDERTRIAGLLKSGYWEMDKYLRARTVYDRTGVIKPNGNLDFYSANGTTAAAGAAAPPAADTSLDDID